MISKNGFKILSLIKNGKNEEALMLGEENQTIEYFVQIKYIEVYADRHCILLARGEEALESYIDSKKDIHRSNIQSIISLILSGLAVISSILIGIFF